MSVLEIIIPTGEIIEREMTPEELNDYKKQQLEIENRQKAQIELQAKKAIAESKLETLGLTKDDLKALGLG